MIERLQPLTQMLMPALLGIYALAFIAGGIYYLEQRVARIRDQFPGRGPMARLIGYAALSIGFLAAFSVGGLLLHPGMQSRWAAQVATASGVGFWVIRVHVEMTRASRVRAGLLAILCLAFTALTGWWIGMS
jgi:hypothetical protein